MTCRRTVFILTLLLYSHASFATWNIVATFKQPAGCAFFFDEQTGFVGFGNQRVYNQQTCTIRKTTDGGMTWKQCISPPGAGIITSIYMKDRTTGYASLMYGSSSALWLTTDGGETWVNPSTKRLRDATCVYATPTAIIQTIWRAPGGSSIDGGNFFSSDFFGATSDKSNGIAFLDDNVGVVTMGPDGFAPFVCKTYRTLNGGFSWSTGANMREAWGVYACKPTHAFYALAEDNATSRGSIVWASYDSGVTWRQIADLTRSGAPTFTGHTAGGASVIYVQSDTITNRGLFRSDDFGKNWHSVGGPSNERDTRFAVTGCQGEVVYAFDTKGNIWKTTDGGDGTIVPKPMILTVDTMTIRSSYCVPAVFRFTMTASDCSPISIDSIWLSDTSGLVQLVHSPTGGFIPISSTDSIQIVFRSDLDTLIPVRIHFTGTSGARRIDTTFTIRFDNRYGPDSGPTLGLVFDSVKVETHYCKGASISFPFTNYSNCNPTVFDTIEFDDPSGEFVITHSPEDGLIPVGSQDSITLQYLSTLNERKIVALHLRCHVGDRAYDTTLYADAFHSRSPEPYLSDPTPTLIGDTVSIAVMLREPTDTINLKHIGFSLAYNGDILTAAGNRTKTYGTLSESYSSLRLDSTAPGGLRCSIELNSPITNASDFSKPIVVLRFLVTLTRSLSCPVMLDSFSIAANVPLSQCDIPSTTFTVLTRCGDSTLSRFMIDAQVPKFASIIPNPADRKIDIVIDPAGRELAGVQILTILGRVVAERIINGADQTHISFDTGALPSGRYILRMMTNDRTTRSAAIEIVH